MNDSTGEMARLPNSGQKTRRIAHVDWKKADGRDNATAMSQEIEQNKELRGKEARKRRILDAAKQLLIEKGNPDISMRALAAAADVSMMTLYNLIGTRDDILALLLKEETGTALSKVRWRKSPTAVEDILSIPGHYFQYLRSDSDYLRTLNTIFLSSAADSVRNEIIAPRRAWWLSFVSQARLLGELTPEVNVDAFVTNLENLLGSAMRNWSSDRISTEAARAKTQYGFALALLGVAADSVRPIVWEFLKQAQNDFVRLSGYPPNES